MASDADIAHSCYPQGPFALQLFDVNPHPALVIWTFAQRVTAAVAGMSSWNGERRYDGDAHLDGSASAKDRSHPRPSTWLMPDGAALVAAAATPAWDGEGRTGDRSSSTGLRISASALADPATLDLCHAPRGVFPLLPQPGLTKDHTQWSCCERPLPREPFRPDLDSILVLTSAAHGRRTA